MMTLLVSACLGGPAEVDDPLTCFPEAARKWIHVGGAEAAAVSNERKPGSATVYVDRSGSMVGYIAGATATERPLQDLIGNLPAMLNMQQLGTRYKAFGTTLSAPLGQAEQGALMQAAYYTCARGGACDNKESRLDNVFKDIAGNKSEMAFVITDLWFSNSDVQTSALSALAEPLAQILLSDRAVAVYGISAPFRGRIFDLPYAAAPLAFQGEHPLFLIAIGSDAQVAAFHEAWKRSPSPYLAQELETGRLKRTLFTLNPAARSEALATPLTGGTNSAIAEAPVMEARENLRIQEFVLAADDAFRPVPGLALPQWRGPEAAAFVVDSAWEGPFTTRTRVWERRDRSCTDGDWLESTPIDGLWADATGPGPRTFSLKADKLAAELGREGTYLIAAEINRTGVTTPNPASRWIRAWGFVPSDTSLVRKTESGAEFFPTLHLSEVARLLENALATASERRRSPLFGFAIVVKVDR